MATATGKIAIGIDLGTANTCVAVWKNGIVDTIPNKMGDFVTPSWVAYKKQEILIGKLAKQTSITHPRNSVFAIKRIIGRKYNDPVVQEAIENWKFKVIEDSGIPTIEVGYRNERKQVYPEEICGLILREMKKIAEAYLEEKNITDVVITVPAYFNDHQRQATMDAAKIAGLNVLRLVNEPTAAAIAYIDNKPGKKKRNILVYNLGCVTFDVSIVTLEGSDLKEKATCGNTNLGGVNFDERCIAYFAKLAKDKYSIHLSKGEEIRFLGRLRNQVERAKHDLSSLKMTNIDLSSAFNGIDFYEKFSRALFDNLNADLYEQTLKIVGQCIREAKLKKEDIDDIVLVGGSTRIPRIEEELQKYFDKPVSKAVNPDHAVAHGAAILAASLKGTLPKKLNILDVTSMALGIETSRKSATGKVAIGIDLGTTNTCVAVCKNGKVETIPNKMGDFVTPSWVTYTNEEVLIGKIAKEKSIRHIPGSVCSIKRIIGRKYNDPVVQEAIKNWKFKVKEDRSGIPKIEVVHKNEEKQVYPEEISGLILREMKEVAQAYLEEKNITDVVITVPAYFNDHQRQATMDAAQIAGLNVLRLINEPTAAAIAYIDDKPEKKKRNILVFDLGGGTFDVSIVTLEGSNVKVKAIRGNTNLGGANFDERCISHFAKVIEDNYNINITEAAEMKFLHRLRNQVEKAKHDLSSILLTNIELYEVCGEIDVDEVFSRARFDALNTDLYEDTLKIVGQCIREAKLTKEDIDDIVLVGGSTRIPRIEEGLQEYFDKPVSKAVNQDHAVAHGAAILAASLNGTLPKELNILDVTSMSLGIETFNGEMSVLIKRNTQIPTQAERVYTTGVDGINEIRIRVLEGDSRFGKKNSVLGFFDLLELPKNPWVEVTFSVDINGILTVNAVETSSGISKTINVTLNKARLSEKEIAMLKSQLDIVKY